MKRTFIATMSLGACLLATAAAQAAAGQHPRIQGYDHWWEYDWDYREYAYVQEVEVVSDGIDVVPVVVRFRSFHPELGYSTFSVSSYATGPGVVDQAQIDAFKAYGKAIIGCADALPGAHAYDNPATLNPASPVPLEWWASDNGQLRSTYFACADGDPPPLDVSGGVCDPAAAPEVLSLTPDSQTFYYVDIALQNGNELTLGFEWDGGGWLFAEQYGAAGDCQGQLDTFTDYTMSILTSQSCAADWVYTPAEETEIAWYVLEAENFCQEVMYNLCDASAAPEVLSLTPDSQTFYYVDVALQNGSELTLGFEWDGGEWQFAEQYGGTGACQGQLNTFTSYTMSILTSPSCAANWMYTPAEEAEIAWYVSEAESFCQEVMYNL